MKANPSTMTTAASTLAERLLAGAAYLSILVSLWEVRPLALYLALLVGSWFLAPAALYVWKRKSSPFLAFHAVQAGLLHLAIAPIVVVALLIGAAVEIPLQRWNPKFGETAAGEAGLRFWAVLFGTLSVLVLIAAWMGVSAMRGKVRALPLLGGVARQIVA